MRLNGEQLGFIPAHVSRGGSSSGLAFQMDRGDKFQCRISSLTGGGFGESRGVNIEIAEGEAFGDAPPRSSEYGAASATSYSKAPTVEPALAWTVVVIIVIIAGCIFWASSK